MDALFGVFGDESNSDRIQVDVFIRLFELLTKKDGLDYATLGIALKKQINTQYVMMVMMLTLCIRYVDLKTYKATEISKTIQ